VGLIAEIPDMAAWQEVLDSLAGAQAMKLDGTVDVAAMPGIGGSGGRIHPSPFFPSPGPDCRRGARMGIPCPVLMGILVQF
jgi:hypothetical protein